MKKTPFLLKPSLKEYLWGGTELKTKYGFQSDADKIAEAWVLSCHADGENRVCNGEYAGKTLSEVLRILGKGAIGKKAAEFPYFPLLIKLIDAKDKLSIQVHPDDAYARKHEGGFGKTEMWYVVDCKPGAELIYGLNRSVSKEEFEERIRRNTLLEICHFVPVHKGDVFFIEAGTLHAIGAGILIAEVQQNSNTTYRVSDYGRLGADGKLRSLHIEKAVCVTRLEPPGLPYGQIGQHTQYSFGTIRHLAGCGLFTAELLSLNGEGDFCEQDTFFSLVVLAGEGACRWTGGSLSFKKGDSLFVPAGLSVTLSGSAEILYSKV